MSRNYMEYVRANAVEESIKEEIKTGKPEPLPPDLERF